MLPSRGLCYRPPPPPPPGLLRTRPRFPPRLQRRRRCGRRPRHERRQPPPRPPSRATLPLTRPRMPSMGRYTIRRRAPPHHPQPQPPLPLLAPLPPHSPPPPPPLVDSLPKLSRPRRARCNKPSVARRGSQTCRTTSARSLVVPHRARAAGPPVMPHLRPLATGTAAAARHITRRQAWARCQGHEALRLYSMSGCSVPGTERTGTCMRTMPYPTPSGLEWGHRSAMASRAARTRRCSPGCSRRSRS